MPGWARTRATLGERAEGCVAHASTTQVRRRRSVEGLRGRDERRGVRWRSMSASPRSGDARCGGGRVTRSSPRPWRWRRRQVRRVVVRHGRHREGREPPRTAASGAVAPRARRVAAARVYPPLMPSTVTLQKWRHLHVPVWQLPAYTQPYTEIFVYGCLDIRGLLMYGSRIE